MAPSVPKAANLSGGGCDCAGSARSRSSAHDGILLIPTDAADPSIRLAPVRITGADPDCCLALPLGVQAFKGRSASSAGRPRSRSIGVCGMPPLDLFPRAAAPFFGRHGPFPMPSGLPQTTASERPRNRRSFSGGFRIRLLDAGEICSLCAVGYHFRDRRLQHAQDCSDAETIHVEVELSSLGNTAWPAAIRGSDHRRPCGRGSGVDKPTIGELVTRRMRPQCCLVQSRVSGAVACNPTILPTSFSAVLLAAGTGGSHAPHRASCVDSLTHLWSLRLTGCQPGQRPVHLE